MILANTAMVSPTGMLAISDFHTKGNREKNDDGEIGGGKEKNDVRLFATDLWRSNEGGQCLNRPQSWPSRQPNHFLAAASTRQGNHSGQREDRQLALSMRGKDDEMYFAKPKRVTQ